LVTLTTVPIFAFFLLRDFDIIVAKIAALIPKAYRPFIGDRFTEIDGALSSFIRGQVSVAALLSVLYVSGFYLVELPLALVVGLIAGIGNLIPLVGTVLGLLFAGLVLLLEGQGWGQVGAVAGVFVVVQLLESWVITPKIVGESVGLSTLGVIVSFMVFGELFGFYGLLLAIPLAAIFKILLRELLDAYTSSRFFSEGPAPAGGPAPEEDPVAKSVDEPTESTQTH
jgi:predicted PurR-regulated permease PerM